MNAPLSPDSASLDMEALATMPTVMSAADLIVWYRQGEGFDLFQQQYARHGMVAFPIWASRVESGTM
jgi:TRAP-type mannitol/chloroaromatic compound transport system substrate-binding protein